MKTLLLSDKCALQNDLEQILQHLDAEAEVWRSADLGQTCWFLARDPSVDVVFIDLAWCRPALLPSVINTIHPWLEHARVVLLLQDLQDLQQPSVRSVRADLRMPRNTPAHTFCTVLAEAVRGVTPPALRLAA
jgi:DNA-binding NarL/FixJ family response regulator